MFKKFKTNYFPNKNYSAIYFHNFFDTLGKSMLEFLSAIILYQLGMPIHFILLFFALKFGFMGMLSPLSLVLTSKIGLNKTILTSSFFYIIGAILLILGNYNNPILLFSSFLFFALKGAIYHPLSNGIISMYVESNQMGKFNSLNTIIKFIGIFISVGIGSLLLIKGLKIYIIFMISFFLIISLLTYVFFLEKKKINGKHSFKTIYSYLFSKDFKENIIPFSSQSFLIIERVLLPLFIFIYFGDLKTTAIIILVSIFVEMIILYFFGKHIDSFSKKSFCEASWLRSFSPIIFLVSYLNYKIVYFGQIYNRIVENIFETSFNTKLQGKAKKIIDPILFTTSKEMALCFAELIFLLILFAISILIKEKIFTLIFLGSFISVWIIYKYWKD